MLNVEIENAQKTVRTDAYQMSIGEIATMYDDRELIVDPEFQRLFRWDIGQKAKFVESILLGIPIPSIFVFEKDDGKWELIDGLQRISTIVEFMGKLRNPDGGLSPPSILVATKYLPSLHNTVWEKSDQIEGVSEDDQSALSKPHQLAIRRARIGVEILKRPSDDQTKFELFQRLNAGGTLANAQEIRNCIMLMVNPAYFRAVKAAADLPEFRSVIAVSEDQLERQRHMEFAVRFLVHTFEPYDGKLDVEEYIDEGMIRLAQAGDVAKVADVVSRTFSLLNSVAGSNAFRRNDNGRFSGKVTLVGLEGIASGVAKNIDAIMQQPDPEAFVRERLYTFWLQPEAASFTQAGMRGTTRIQKTVPFGALWFRP